MLAACCSIEPSVCVKIIWQFAWIFAQASSKPFFTACQNVFDGDEWMVKAMLSGSASADAGRAPSARHSALAASQSVFSCHFLPW